MHFKSALHLLPDALAGRVCYTVGDRAASAHTAQPAIRSLGAAQGATTPGTQERRAVMGELDHSLTRRPLKLGAAADMTYPQVESAAT